LYKVFAKTAFIGKKAVFLPSCHSTNDIAALFVTEQKAVHGKVVFTDFQTKGKGQRGNVWESAQGENITFSVLLNVPFVDPADNFLLTIVASLSIHDFLSDYLRDQVKIKWPNDIMVGGRKIAGILIENFIKKSSLEWSIIGVGLNVNQAEFGAFNATSLANLCQQRFDREEVMDMLLCYMEKRYMQLKRGETKNLREHYLLHLFWKDEVHVFKTKNTFFNGCITGVSDMGKLAIETEDGTRQFAFKEVEFIK
jgi:BirA family biotin operon repressor/biotin-[acetyl-CoA-carboxylase] ligase